MMPLNDPVSVWAISGDLALRLGLAAVLGLLLGLDRELRGYAAGLRTHGLVCLATSVMTVSAIGLFGSMDMRNADPLRIYEAAGAFAGIIGAALIVFSRGRVHNLTTAAHLFLTAIVGIACGAGQWPLVAIAAPIGLAMLSLLRIVEDKSPRRRIGKPDDGPQD